MNRDGFALLAVLWVLAALGALAGVTLLTAREGHLASRNRLVLARTEWAREACVEITLGRFAADSGFRILDTTDLGRGTWCAARLIDPSSRLNVNVADSIALRAVLGGDSLVDALMDWRDEDTIARRLGAEAHWYRAANRALPRNGPLVSVREVLLVRGFGSVPLDRLEALLTTDGSGRIGVNAAGPEVLATVPGLGSEAIALVLARRGMGESISSSDQLLGRLSPAGRKLLADGFQGFLSRTTFAPTRYVLEAFGGVHGYPLRSEARLEVAPAGHRLAVISREVQ